VERVTGRTVASSVAPRRPGDPAVLYASAQRAREELDWVPARPAIDAIVGDAWRWHQKTHNLATPGSR
jgi:UDP-glucose 4-epimerase